MNKIEDLDDLAFEAGVLASALSALCQLTSDTLDNDTDKAGDLSGLITVINQYAENHYKNVDKFNMSGGDKQ
ncbi:hypothetical protein OUY26_04115 [Levilactobacillus brevis]|uniref:hypothetical protein n=1 Tax=Levilactobacillus brevis TaxID=1580 RepID=UPI002279B77E|nr:hypothetical protein [Levilactobacillus brevis]WAE45791.1 hypothetical protein OUY26_04115 [Levilactobacillus brevis]